MKQNWEIKTLEEVCKTTSGGTPLKTHKEYYDGGTIPWIQSGEVSKKYIDKSDKFITELGLKKSSAKLFPKETVLVAMYGATAGQVGILKIEATTNQAICGILPNDKFIPEYIYYYLLSVKDELLKKVAGVAQPNLSQQTIKSIKIPLPPLPEQQRIVEEMDREFDKIRTIRNNAEKVIAHCDALKQALLRKAFDGEL